MANRIKYGLSNVYYAVATIDTDGSATYSTPVRLPGAVNLSLDPEGDSSTFFADNIAYATFTANAGYSGSLELALIPDEFRTAVLGDVNDSTTGLLIENAGAASVHFALLFEFSGDANATRHVMYNCTASRPSVTGATTESSIEAQTETLNLQCASIYNDTLKKDITKAKAESTATAYASFFSAVQQP